MDNALDRLPEEPDVIRAKTQEVTVPLEVLFHFVTRNGESLTFPVALSVPLLVAIEQKSGELSIIPPKILDVTVGRLSQASEVETPSVN